MSCAGDLDSSQRIQNETFAGFDAKLHSSVARFSPNETLTVNRCRPAHSLLTRLVCHLFWRSLQMAFWERCVCVCGCPFNDSISDISSHLCQSLDVGCNLGNYLTIYEGVLTLSLPFFSFENPLVASPLTFHLGTKTFPWSMACFMAAKVAAMFDFDFWTQVTGTPLGTRER